VSKDLLMLSEPWNLALLRDQTGKYPVFWPVGNRHKDGMTLRLALREELENLLL
jgi:hypothetical protein